MTSSALWANSHKVNEPEIIVSKTIKILLGAAVLLVAVSAAIFHFGPEYDESLLRAEELRIQEQYSGTSHGGFRILGGEEPAGERWIAIGGLVLIVAFAFAIAAVKLWAQNESEAGETLKEHLAHSRTITTEKN